MSHKKGVSDRSAALLLTSIAEIASKEIDVNRNALDERDAGTHAIFQARVRKISFDVHPAVNSVDRNQDLQQKPSFYAKGCTKEKNSLPVVDWHAIVSDSSQPNSPILISKKPKEFSSKVQLILSKAASQVGARKSLKRGAVASSMISGSGSRANHSNTSVAPKKTILRKKFSWKNYPELEAFLIMNRDEYLRHSALNYTIQQKQYNNRLTERLLELALDNGYVFDDKDFSFVTVRDRIRCYYKSFVQSSKKRGIIIGYAAKRAGLIDKAELKESVGRSAKIHVPSHG